MSEINRILDLSQEELEIELAKEDARLRAAIEKRKKEEQEKNKKND